MPTTPVLSVPLFQVNTGDSPGPGANAAANNSQINSKVTALTNGNFLVVWQDGSSQTSFEPYDIRGQLYDSSATRVGTEFYVSNFYQDLNQQAADIAALPGGGFAAAYQTTDAANFHDGENITVQIFDATGLSVRSDDFRQGNGVPHGIDDTSPTITSFSDGHYVLVYEETDTNNPAAVTELVGYSVDAAGVRSAKFGVETSPTNATGPSAATLSNGTFVVGFEVPGASSVNFSIHTATGGPVFETAIATTHGAAHVDVAALIGGGFVMAWQDADGDGAGDAGIRIAIYDNLGNPIKSSFAADVTTTVGAQIEPAVTALADGGFVVAWNDDASNTVKAQVFTAAGSLSGDEVTIASLNDMRDPSLGALTDGRFVVAADNDSGADFDIEAAVWNAAASQPALFSEGNDTVTLPGPGSYYALGGNDIVSLLASGETAHGGAGNETYRVEATGTTIAELAGEGTDTVQTASLAAYSLGANIENLTHTGSNNFVGIGNALNNVMIGGAGNDYLIGLDGNDVLIDGGGLNTLQGGTGNDTYAVQSSSDTVFEFANEGTDQVQTFLSAYHLTANVENLTFIGAANHTGIGNELSNVLIGGTGDDYLIGLDGNDVLIDGSGLNTLQGGAGDDIYAVQSNADTVFEFANEGTDQVQTFLSSYTLSNNVENLTFVGNISHTGIGNALNNVITGAGGADTFTGAGGADTFNFRAVSPGVIDAITDFNADNANAAEHDHIDLGGRGLNFGSLSLTSSSGGTLVAIPGGDAVFLQGVPIGTLDANDFFFA